ncbi:hypothetical protein ACFS2C_15295 [Prauserella oleivorans]|uniref:Uncharacterized protein n=1 Tax=Prauserella oleivorans TaxID=1478153 RepID=A0ABW5WA39_9PSEU
MDNLPTLDRESYLRSQAAELRAATKSSDSRRAVQIIRHVFAEAGTESGFWLADWYCDTITREGDPVLREAVDACLRDLEQTYPRTT